MCLGPINVLLECLRIKIPGDSPYGPSIVNDTTHAARINVIDTVNPIRRIKTLQCFITGLKR